jgi:hypothetical protein
MPVAKISPTGLDISRGQLPIQCLPDENYHHQVTATASTEPAPQ